MRRQAQRIRRAGRFGDTELVHLNRRELGYLSQVFGAPTTNPQTGLPEFFDWGGVLRTLAPIALPVAGEALGGAGTLGALGEFFGASPAWAPTAASAGIGALTGGLTSALTKKDILSGALTGGLLGGMVPSAGRALGFGGFQTPFNIPTLFDVGSMFDAAPSTSAIAAGTTAAETASPFASKSDAASAASGASSKGGWLSRNPWAVPVATLGLSALASTSSKQPTSQSTAPSPKRPASWENYEFPRQSYDRKRRTAGNSAPGEYMFFERNELPDVPISAARGGALSTTARRVSGPGDARDDLIPAMLSNKEYVMDGESMALLGNGDPDAGADKMDKFRVDLRKHKGKAMAKGKFSPNAKPVEGYLS